MSEKLEVIFLGTGGGAPTSKRYLPSVALRLGGRWILLDTGEGTQIRLRESGLGWGGLQAIFISHLHGDHILGLPGLLMSFGMAHIETPLAIYGPPGLEAFLAATLRTCHVQLPFPLSVHALPTNGGVILRTPTFVVDCFPLQHRIPCWGFAFREPERPGRFFPELAIALGIPPGPLFKTLQQGTTATSPSGRLVLPQEVMGPPRPGRVVVYCTDTSPCDAVIIAAKEADLLIHDATFTSDYTEEARISGHSTATQAATSAATAGCSQLVLTHISARFEDEGVLAAEARSIFPHSQAARDLLVLDIPARQE